ncbi:MAG: glutamate 5-kinase [Candidatus Omnitrophota bacterium]
MRHFETCKKVVVKAGTSILTSTHGHFSEARLNGLGEQVAGLFAMGKQVTLVSSGAIGCGMDVLGLKKRPREMALLQACAAIGQGKLIHAYEKFFFKKGIPTAQVLLTRDGLEQRDRFLKARQTFSELLRLGALPIVNENDTVSTEEIAFGDNDILSVHVAHLVQADLLIILSDVDGFFLTDGTRVRRVGSELEIDRDLVKHLRGKAGEKTVGGMRAKLEAARVAMRLGIPLLLVNGGEEQVLSRALRNEDVGTYFLPGGKQYSAKKNWIAFSAKQKGVLVIDEGAAVAVGKGDKSLLMGGVTGMRGNFRRKDVVLIETQEGQAVGRGVVRYDAGDLGRVLGKKLAEAKEILGSAFSGEVILRDNLIIW